MSTKATRWLTLSVLEPAAYAILFVIAWFAIYIYIFLARQPVTP